ncbi:hypothetical protein BU097_05420 [Staphylococcus xylosus]|uniref:Uncharacterized protein n=1 Tax=Staphylococcus xylosus TaxID=1288 RepID=A0A418IPL8_STAXY|nr:hypothetical protein [Staphylococcus xylosus]RIN11396.1 hypothetical protein BU097_05420 [Staphylococcus xylosus]
MEIRLCDITNNKTDIRDYFLVEDGKILINGTHLYDVILDTDKATLHQQMEMFDSKDEMFRKAKAFDEIVNLLKTDYMQYADDNLEDIEIIINEYMERADDEH